LKECPAGKIKCEHFDEDGQCRATGIELSSGEVGFLYVNEKDVEQCPWPSKQKEYVGRVTKAWFIYMNRIRDHNTTTQEDFESSLKEAGFTDD